MLILNAGIMACPETRVGPGWEAQFATNHLGHFALTNLLWPALASQGGARVVSLASAGHHFSPIRWDDIQFEHGYEKFPAYGQSKTATILFSVELDRRGAEHGVRAFSVHPGGIMTPLQRHMPKEEMIALGWIDESGQVANPAFKTPEQGQRRKSGQQLHLSLREKAVSTVRIVTSVNWLQRMEVSMGSRSMLSTLSKLFVYGIYRSS